VSQLREHRDAHAFTGLPRSPVAHAQCVLSPSGSARVCYGRVSKCGGKAGSSLPDSVRRHGSSPRTPATVTVTSSSPTRGLMAYTNTQIYLIGPRGMRSSGVVAVDGGSRVIVWPQGHSRPAPHARAAGLTLTLDSACVGCMADDACPFFTALARDLGFPCASGVPQGERVVHLRSNIILFEDPSGVAGSGWPSGGEDPANGLVGYDGSPRSAVVYRSTCTLPATEHSVCTTSLNDVIRRYG
jgi:hypothetical protein